MGAFAFYAHHSNTTPLKLFLQGVAWMRQHPLGPLIFLVAFCCRPLTMIPASLFSASAGFCFGAAWGFVWAHLAGTLAALLFYGLGRWMGLRRGLAGWWDRAIVSLQQGGLVSLIILRFCFLPYDPVSYLGGALHLPLAGFVVANFIGNFPGTTSCVLLGAAMHGTFEYGKLPVNWRLLAASWVMLVTVMGLGRWLRRRAATNRIGGSSSSSGEGSAQTD